MIKLSLTTVALPHLSLEETAALASRLGYDGVELRVRRVPAQAVGQPYSFWGNHKHDLTPDNLVRLAPQIRQVCRDHGLTVPALASNATAADLEDIQRLAEGAALLDCPLVRIGAPRRYDGTVPYRELYAEAVDAFGRALEAIKPFGRRGLLEIHAGTITVSAGLAFRLVSSFPPESIGVVYDVNNMVREGFEGLRLGLDLLGPYLAHVHHGGHSPHAGARGEDGTLGWAWSMTELADGLLDTPALIAELRRAGYGGFISVEDFRTDLDPEAKFGAAAGYLRGLLAGGAV